MDGRTDSYYRKACNASKNKFRQTDNNKKDNVMQKIKLIVFKISLYKMSTPDTCKIIIG